MAGKIHLEIVTPSGLQLSKDVDEFTAPSVQGEFGVLPSHRPLLAGLKTGIVSYVEGGESHQVAIGPGFAKVADDRANLLTDRFIAKQDVDPVVARKDLKEAEEALASRDSHAGSEETARLVGDARWAAVRLELYGDPPPATAILPHEIKLLAHEDYADTAVYSEGAVGRSGDAEGSEVGSADESDGASPRG